MPRLPVREAQSAISTRQAFTSDSALTAEFGPPRYGHLPHEEVFKIQKALAQAGRELYVVYSYNTPIAWAGPGEPLYLPNVKYSATTSRHQSVVRRASNAVHVSNIASIRVYR